MRRAPLIASIVFVLATILSSRPSEAALTTSKPDLKVVSIGPSPAGSSFTRFVVTNAGFAWSGPCALRITTSASAALYYWQIPALAPITIFPGTSTVAVDVPLGGASISGTVFFAVADAWQQVTESNESNNSLWYVAP